MPDFDPVVYFRELDELMEAPEEDMNQWLYRLTDRQSQTPGADEPNNYVKGVNAALNVQSQINEWQAPLGMLATDSEMPTEPQSASNLLPKPVYNSITSAPSQDFVGSLPISKRKAQDEPAQDTSKRTKHSHDSHHAANLDCGPSRSESSTEGVSSGNAEPNPPVLGVPLVDATGTPLPSPMPVLGSESQVFIENFNINTHPATVGDTCSREPVSNTKCSHLGPRVAEVNETGQYQYVPSEGPAEGKEVRLATSIDCESDDIEEVPPPQRHALRIGSSLYKEVRERVAQHPAAKRQRRVVNLGNADHGGSVVPSDYVDDDSIIEVSSPPASSPPPTPKKPRALALKPQGTKNGLKSVQVQLNKAEATKAGRQSKTKSKEKSPLLLPADYVQSLHKKAKDAPRRSTNTVQFLEGNNILYIGGDLSFASQRTRRRMDLIVKYGGNLLPQYDATVVTHIVTDAPELPTLRALGLRRLDQIPDHIPTVTWKWISFGIANANTQDKEQFQARMGEVWQFAAYSSRLEAGMATKSSNLAKGRNKGKGKDKAQGVQEPSYAEFSRISEFTPDKRPSMAFMSSPVIIPSDDPISDLNARQFRHNSSKPSGSGNVANKPTAGDRRGFIDDPLAEFYAQARAEAKAETDSCNSDGEDDAQEITLPSKGPRSKRGFTCDNKEPQVEACVNQDIIDKLEELMELHKAKPTEEDRWKVLSYSKCIPALRKYPRRIKSLSEARSIRGVGEKTAQKIMEILETGRLKRIEHERTDDVQITKLFQGIYGVGRSTAFKWYANGCRTLDDLMSGRFDVRLTPAQEIGIKYYDDINSRMPREEAKAIFDLIKPIALRLDPDLLIEIMGSYRRGKNDCGDIDILITCNPADGRTHAGILRQLLPLLHDAGILTEDLALPEDPNDPEVTYRGLCRLPNVEGSRRRRIDFLTVPWQSRGAALLYYTGDDIFNRAMRLKANVMGYSLNQKGLFAGVVRDPHDRRVKLNAGSLVASETEVEIFKVLNIPWQEPHERVRG